MRDLDRLQEMLDAHKGIHGVQMAVSDKTRQDDVDTSFSDDGEEEGDGGACDDDDASESYSIEEVRSWLRELAYPGEFKDRELLETRYNLSTYLDAIAHKKNYAEESISQRAINASVPILPQFMPHIYDIAQSVLSNLKIDFDEIADGGIEVRLMSSADRNLFVNVKSTENGLMFSFVLSRAYLSGYKDEEIAYFWGIRLYEALFDTERYGNLTTEDEDGTARFVLPKYAELIRKRIYFESLISMDRIGLLACRNLESAQKALIKERHSGELGNRWLQIPSDEELEELAKSGMYILNANHQMTEVDFIPIRLRCMRKFWADYQSNPNEETKNNVDSYVSQSFKDFMPSPMSEKEEYVVNLVASVGVDMITQDRKVCDSEIRILLEELLKMIAPPSLAIITSTLERASRKRKAIKYFRENGASYVLLESLARLVINSGGRFEHNNEQLVKLLMQLGIGEADTLRWLTEAYREVKYDVDPLMDDLIARARARLAGKASPVVRRHRATLSDWDKMSLVEKIRYSGDVEAVEELGSVYHLNAMIRQCESAQESLATSDLNVEYLNHLHLTPEISPRVCKIVERVCKVLNYDEPLEVFCEKPGNGLNACAWIDVAKDGRKGIVNINPEAIEAFEDDELAYLIGHEIGHLIYRHGQWAFVVKSKEDKSTMLPFMGDRLYWEWNQKCEISADRAGAVAAGNADAALRALLKVCYGLSPKNLDVNADVLLSQLKVVQEAEELEDSARWAKELSHPINPIRINALKAFCDVYYAKGYCALKLTPEDIKKVDNKIADGYELLRSYPRTKARKAAMQLVALYGLNIIHSDGIIEDRELAELIQTLMIIHTDRPIDELIGETRARDKAITEAAEILSDSDDDDLKKFTMLQLSHLALVDGTISTEDRELLCNAASLIDLGEFDVDSCLQEAAESSEFPVDFLLEAEVKKVREMLKS